MGTYACMVETFFKAVEEQPAGINLPGWFLSGRAKTHKKRTIRISVMKILE